MTLGLTVLASPGVAQTAEKPVVAAGSTVVMQTNKVTPQTVTGPPLQGVLVCTRREAAGEIR
jgi:hypothetical protein